MPVLLFQQHRCSHAPQHGARLCGPSIVNGACGQADQEFFVIEKLFTAIAPSVGHYHVLGYFLALMAALLETTLGIGLFLPGSTLLLLLGALAAGSHLDFGGLWLFAVVGAVLGDNLNYWLGQRYGGQWSRNGIWFLTPEFFEKSHRFFDRNGPKSVFLGRFIPSIKEVVPFIAGTVGMRYRTFLLWNVLGAMGWGLQWVGGGYLFGQSFKLAQTWMPRISMMLAATIAVWMLLWLLQRFVASHGREIWWVAVSLGRSIKGALNRNAYVRRWVSRHPDCIHFISRRMDRSHFQGLPLTILFLAFAYVLALFAGIVEDVIASGPIVAADHAAAQLVAAFRSPAAIAPFAWIANLGSPALVIVLLVVACLFLWLFNRRYAAVGLVVSTLGASALLTAGKLAFQRPRPSEAIIVESSFSFPSGHATLAFAFYGFVGYLLIRSAARWNTRVRLFFVTVGFVLLIGASRIVLGVHYLSDVWAGYLIGALWAIAGISVNEWLNAGGRIAWDAPVDPRRKVLALGLAVIAACGAIGYATIHKPVFRVPSPEPTVQTDRPLTDILQAGSLSRTTTFLGAPEQPLAFVIVAPDESALAARLTRSGWLAADKMDTGNMLHLARKGLDYATAPLAPAFWNNQINPLAFERLDRGPQGNVLSTVRIWRTPFRLNQNHVFVGVAREYSGIRWGFMHTVLPDVDAAAERFAKSLEAVEPPLTACQQTLYTPMMGTLLMGGSFFTRGQIWLLDLGTESDIAQLCKKESALQ